MNTTHSNLFPDAAPAVWLRSRVVRAPGTARQERPDLRGTDFADVVISEVVGEGRRCLALAARRGNRDLILKVYHRRATARHARRCGGSLAQYEHERNAAFRRVAELVPYIAAPIGFWSSPCGELFLQERVIGEPLIPFLRTCARACREGLLDELRTILVSSHQASLFDLDLHPSNIIVRREQNGVMRPVLFDFNKVPYHVQPPNAVFGMFVKLGLVSRRSRDRRQWKRLERLHAGASCTEP